ncbi:MAG: carboxypeptidase regulatory-like domain-containing protein [Candidatus Acidiferrales bacterium]
MNWKRFFVVVFALLVALSIGSTRLAAQTSSTGDVAGVVTDPSNAVVPDAKVNLKDNAKGNTQDSKTNKDGAYRFYLLPPGSYTITVSASGFSAETKQVNVALGQITNVNFQLALGAATQTITVTEAAPLMQTENGNVASTLNERQVQEVPNPGNDLSYIAQTAPGVVMNTQAGYGNFSANGLPGNSNLFTINGMDDNDPYLNLNNSGATNLLLGQNEVQEATVVSNGYSGQYGTLAGANITYITKSGGNDYHGRAIYYWNGSAMNAEAYLTKAGGAPKPFSNANQWGGDMGGPIKKDKLFWYVNTEGLRVILPTSADVFVPTQAFEAQVIQNLNNNGLSASIPFYCQNIAGVCPAGDGAAAGSKIHANGAINNGNPVTTAGVGMFNLYNAAPGIENATPIPFDKNFDLYFDDSSTGGNGGTGFYTGGGCSNYPGLGVADNLTDAAALPACAQQFRSTAGNFTYEYVLSGRVDYNYGSKDRIFMRVQTDRGDQATYTDTVNPLFNAHSFQPEYQGQLVETHTFGATAVNQFIMSTAWYSAIFTFGNLPATYAAFPTNVILGDGSLADVGGINFDFPQGRNVTQFQISDDFSKTYGNHAMKIGMKFRRYDVTDHGYQIRLNGEIVPISLDDFAWGGTGNDTAVSCPTCAAGNAPIGGSSQNAVFTENLQRFPTALTQPIANYTVAGYIEDGFRVRPNLTITGSLRIEHASNPICRHLCFAETDPWDVLDHNVNTPYNQAIHTGLEQMLPGFTNIQWEPRVSFAWQPLGTSHNLVVRGGIGIFYDGFQGSLANSYAGNPPELNRFTVLGDNLSPTETTGNLFADAAAINNAFVQGVVTGQNLAQIKAVVAAQGLGSFFKPPALTSSSPFVNAPQYQKWSLEVQQGFGRNMSLSVQYVGNHGIHEVIQNAGVNAFSTTFAGLPGTTTAPDARFLSVNNIQSTGLSNYNGLIISFKRQWGGGIVNFNYAWSHAFDESEGLDPFNLNTNSSIRFQEDPFNLRRNYGPADWDVRHYISANYLWELPVRKALMGHGWKPLVDGWQVSGTVFFRTGLPYTVTDGTETSSLGSKGYGSTVFANYTGATYPQAYISCGGNGLPDTCLDTSLFLPAKTGFGNLGRNSFYGPHFFDSDFTIMKKTKIPGWERGELGIGFQMFNVFNHPNFDQPFQNATGAGFGQTFLQVGSPTSILGSFLGGDNSPRLIQLKMQFTF